MCIKTVALQKYTLHPFLFIKLFAIHRFGGYTLEFRTSQYDESARNAGKLKK